MKLVIGCQFQNPCLCGYQESSTASERRCSRSRSQISDPNEITGPSAGGPIGEDRPMIAVHVRQASQHQGLLPPSQDAANIFAGQLS